MNELMKLVDDYVERCMGPRSEKARAALQSAIETLQAERDALAAKLATLEAELEKRRKEIQNQYRCINSHAVLTQRAEADVERMDWLDKYAHIATWVDGEPTKLVIDAASGEEFTGETWRECIDAAKGGQHEDA